MQEMQVQSLGWEDSPGEENGNPFQYSCLETPMDGGAWQATIHGVTKSWIWPSDFTFFTFTFFLKKICRWQNQQMKRCSLLYVIKKMQIKTMRYHYTCIRMATILNNEKPNPGENTEWQNTHSLPLAMQNSTATLWNSLAVPYKTEHTLTIQRAVTFFSIYLKELKVYVPTKTCTHMLIAALFVTAKTWKQPRIFSRRMAK